MSSIKTQLQLKVDFLGISVNHNVGSLRSLHFKICQMIYLCVRQLSCYEGFRNSTCLGFW